MTRLPMACFEGRVDDVRRRSIVAEMNDFSPLGLKDSTHDVDCCIVSVKK